MCNKRKQVLFVLLIFVLILQNVQAKIRRSYHEGEEEEEINYNNLNQQQNSSEEVKNKDFEGWTNLGNYLNGFKYVQKIYNECGLKSNDTSSCLKIKLIKMMDNFAKMKYNNHKNKKIDVIDGVSLVFDEEGQTSKYASFNADYLPRGFKDNTLLNEIIMDKAINFLNSHKLQIKFNSFVDVGDDEGNVEGRGRRRKNSGMFMIPLILGGTLIPLALGGLALFAGKALLVSKLALVLAIIIGLKKLLGGNEVEKSHEVYIAPHDSGHSRSYQVQRQDPHKLVYRGYVSKK